MKLKNLLEKTVNEGCGQEHEEEISEAKMNSKAFAKAVKDEFDVETLQLMQTLIQKQIDLLNKMGDMANPRKTVKGFKK